jgi:hypothetical protein
MILEFSSGVVERNKYDSAYIGPNMVVLGVWEALVLVSITLN